MVYGVAIQTLGRTGGNGITMVIVGASEPAIAEVRASRFARARFGCEVLADHAVPCPGFAPTAEPDDPDEHYFAERSDDAGAASRTRHLAGRATESRPGTQPPSR
jgi:hypothetical protein